eukprot:scaffold5774_cov67-Phaeocystis_antarctica.AAC.5
MLTFYHAVESGGTGTGRAEGRGDSVQSRWFVELDIQERGCRIEKKEARSPLWRRAPSVRPLAPVEPRGAGPRGAGEKS